MFRKRGPYEQSIPSLAYQQPHRRPFRVVVIGLFAIAAVGLIAKQWQPVNPNIQQPEYKVTAQVTTQPLTKKGLRQQLTPFIHQGQYPSQIRHQDQTLDITYTLDPALQAWAEARLKRYNPDYASFVALDPDTGKVLAMTSSRRDNGPSADLPFKATYPGASTFKLITAVAVLEEGIATPNTVYSFNGKSTSLYKSQVFSTKRNKWTRDMSLTTAFAKSVNPIFGRIGAKQLGAEKLSRYALKYGYNAQFTSDFDFDNGSVNIDENDEWQVVEAASGYTRANTLSPVHGAAIAASIINGGRLIPPSVVESVHNDAGDMLYESSPPSIDVITDQTSKRMQKLMQATVKDGSGRKNIGKLSRKKAFKNAVVGAKTGHLRGNNPKGSYDWIIGYGIHNDKRIAFAVMCINKEKWYVKSGDLAREALEFYFKEP
ncbi:MAG: peptidoglycan glycosyltransferase [Saprospiraceae bacterium]|jgi:peptidoglycan glycosyltransferase